MADPRWNQVSAALWTLCYNMHGYELSATVKAEGSRWIAIPLAKPMPPVEGTAATARAPFWTTEEAMEWAEEWLHEWCSKLTRMPC